MKKQKSIVNNEKIAIYPTLNELTSEYFTVLNYFSETFENAFEMQFHAHPQCEIMYCENGGFVFEYKLNEKSQIQSTKIYENSFIFINAGFFHRIKILGKNVKILNLEFLPTSHFPLSDKNITPLAPKLVLNIKELFSLSKQLEKLKIKNEVCYAFKDFCNVATTIKNIISLLVSPQTNETPFFIQFNMAKLFLDISQCNILESDKYLGISYISHALTYINENFTMNISVDDIAKAANISTTYLQRLFKSEMNTTVYKVLNMTRIKYAKYLLSDTNITNTEVANICGFNSREQLIYEFKKVENCTPSEYRNRNHNATLRNFNHLGEIKK